MVLLKEKIFRNFVRSYLEKLSHFIYFVYDDSCIAFDIYLVLVSAQTGHNVQEEL